MKYYNLIILVTVMLNLYNVNGQQKVLVQVVYESLCPDSIKFITKQLYPTLQHENFVRNIDLELIPFGKSKKEYLDGWHFTCHHGPNECYGNTVQVCALKHSSTSDLSSNKQTLGYINCLMQRVDPKATPFIYPTRECALPNNIQTVDAIERCANSTEGQQALSDAGTIQANIIPDLKSVPTVIFNRHFDEIENNMAISNFRKALCDKLDYKERVSECEASSANISYPTYLLFIVFFTFLFKFN